MSLVSASIQLLMLVAGCTQEVSSRRRPNDRRNRTHVEHIYIVRHVVARKIQKSSASRT